jgi:hypothetical protein
MEVSLSTLNCTDPTGGLVSRGRGCCAAMARGKGRRLGAAGRRREGHIWRRGAPGRAAGASRGIVSGLHAPPRCARRAARTPRPPAAHPGAPNAHRQRPVPQQGPLNPDWRPAPLQHAAPAPAAWLSRLQRVPGRAGPAASRTSPAGCRRARAPRPCRCPGARPEARRTKAAVAARRMRASPSPAGGRHAGVKRVRALEAPACHPRGAPLPRGAHPRRIGGVAEGRPRRSARPQAALGREAEAPGPLDAGGATPLSARGASR